ncbi:MAG: sulfite exporter TauE/SafE family protein, partial [Deltaproteobacteria bacterium]|nr:sulfite exporter TauE/SafE family protein [Kofleriaceae bacterium]
MTALLATVLASSLVGSLHCAAMCGPLQGLYLDAKLSGGAGERWRRPLAHAAGRL